MRPKTALRAISIAAVTLLGALGTASPVSGGPGPTSHVDSLAAAVSGDTIAVNGEATFVDVPVVVANDAAGDVPVTGAGLDITTVTFSRPDPAAPTLRLRVGVADQTPTVFGGPTTLYHFPVTVNGEISQCGGGTGFFFPEARIVSINPADTSPSFRMMCDLSPGGVATIGTIPGQIGGGAVQWDFPIATIGAKGGDTLGHGGDCVDPGTTNSPGGAAWLCNNGGGGDMVSLEDYVIPAPSVSLGIAPAGTPPDQVALTSAATVSGSGFTGSLPKPAAAGSYVLAAKACFGSQSCGLSSVELTV